MERVRKIVAVFFLAVSLSCASCQTVSALTESEVQEQVEAAGKESVSGNVLVWFLCAIAFLKVSQKIDSFMSGLGINVGHTGSSMIAEAMVAARGLGAVRGLSGKHFGAGGSAGSSGRTGTLGSVAGAGGFLAGGLAGIISRQARNGAASAATTSGDAGKAGRGTLGGKKGSHAGGLIGMAGRQIYASSVSKGGGFANDVIGNVATGSISAHGVMTGEKAAEALRSYMGYAAMGEGAEPMPAFTNVEIGGGRITGTEVSEGHPEGIAFGMYCAAQYAAPEGAYDTVHTADGTAWYRQYASRRLASALGCSRQNPVHGGRWFHCL